MALCLGPDSRDSYSVAICRPKHETAIGFASTRSRGYSLVELVAVMTIVAIVVGIAVPSYKYVTNSNRVSAEVNLLLGDMQYARSEAVKEGTIVSVCPGTATPSGSTFTGTCSGAINWQTAGSCSPT